MSPRLRITAGIVLLLATALPVVAGQFGRFFLPSPTAVEYDSRFAFTRIRYGTRIGGNGGWEHDYPTAGRNFAAILDYTTHMRVHLDGSNIFDLDDPRIFQNPVIYMSEPGGWTTDEAEATNLRTYLLKGGFIIFDDFDGDGGWRNLVTQMKVVLPDHDFIRLDVSHPIFHSFCGLRTLNLPHPMLGRNERCDTVGRAATMRIVIELPDDIANALHQASGDVSRGAVDAIASEGYRAGLLTRHQVGQLLGLSFWEAEAFLKQRHADLGYTEEDLNRDRDDIERASRE